MAHNFKTRFSFSKIAKNKENAFLFVVDLANFNLDICQFWACLSIEEKIQSDKFYNEHLRYRYIIGRGMLRNILSYFCKQSPKKVSYIYNQYGKPFLINSNIQFNISHSNMLICYVVTTHGQIGIDIQSHLQVKDITRIADFLFTPFESDYYHTLSKEQQTKYFYCLWARKESLVKADGRGLSYNIKSIELVKNKKSDKIFLVDNKIEHGWYQLFLDLRKNYSCVITMENKINNLYYLNFTHGQFIIDHVKYYYLCSSLSNICNFVNPNKQDQIMIRDNYAYP